MVVAVKRGWIPFVLVGLLFVGACAWERASFSKRDGDVAADAAENRESGVAVNEEGEPLEAVPEEVTEFRDVNHWNVRRILPESDLPVVVNDRVLAWMEYFTGRGRPIFEKWLERKAYFEPMFRKVLVEHGLPVDLVYLSMIESGFNPKAYSRARASGPWQFMTGTGRIYGLRVNDWVDERRDPIKSTHAAAKHLSDLYETFGDWYLAAAAYNAGAGKVERAIGRHQSRDFWDLADARKPYLRAETRNYVPKLLAALIIGKQPHLFGFKTAYEGDQAVCGWEAEVKEAYQAITDDRFEVVTIDDATDLKVIAQCAGVKVDTVRYLNPEIRHWFTPPHDKTYTLRLPVGSREPFLAQYGEIPAAKRLTFRSHVLRNGETLGQVARIYGTNVQSLMELNKITNPRRVRAGKVLYIPMPRGVSKTVARQEARVQRPVASNQDSREIKVKVQSGDTLWALSQRYSVSVQSIKQWNSLKSSRHIFPGDVLTIYVGDV